MSGGNSVTLVGNLARDVELRFTASGQAVANFGLAVNRVWYDADGKKQEEVSFFDVTCWREMAENVSESLTKGARAFVTGRLDQSSWENEAGEKRTKISITADDVGPSLRWATAQIVKNERREGSAPVRDAPGGYPGAYEEPF